MYEKEWLPNAMLIGISYNDFWNMNPRIMKIHIEGYKKRVNTQLDYDNYVSYLSGVYVREALASTVGNMFLKKGAKPYDYPKEPLPITKEQSERQEEAKMEAQRQIFWANLQNMQANFELNHKGDKK